MQKINSKTLFNDLYNRITVYEAEESKEMAALVLEKYLGLKKTDLLINQPVEVSEDLSRELDQVIIRINHSEPVQYILNEQWFRNRRFEVNRHVLIPRPETEELIDHAIKYAKDLPGAKKILDIGTGSGCIAVSLALEIENAEVTALDISETALDVAKKNALNNQAEIRFLNIDVLDPASFPEEKYDIIASNPPYVKENEKGEMRRNVLDFEPGLALFVKDDDALLFYRRIADLGQSHLTAQGFIIVEINSYLGKETSEMFREKGFGKVTLIKDFFERDRFIIAWP
jgi:release factor glutamine methyltransferase